MKKLLPEKMDLQIAISIALCMVTYYLVPSLQVLSACTAALMCAQGAANASFKSGLTRLLTTVLGGALAVLVVLADNAAGSRALFVAMFALGILLTLGLCRLCKTPPIAGRIGCVTFILVVVVASGEGRVWYALNRLIATAYGAAVSVAVAVLWGAIFRERKQSGAAGASAGR